jgi:hypothetical protein
MVTVAGKDYGLKTTIKADGVTIDNPISGVVTKITNKASTCSLTYPNENGKMLNYLPWNTVIEVYLGLGAVEASPVFTGILVSKKGREKMTFSFTDLFGYLKRHKDIQVDDFTNFDGMEAGQSIIEVADGGDYSMYNSVLSTDGVQGTNPVVVLDDTFRFTKSSNRYEVIRGINDKCWDISGYPKEPEPYILYMRDNVLHQEKQTRLEDATAIHTIATADNLLTSSPSWELTKLVNKQTVYGANYTDGYERKRTYVGTHDDDASIKTFGVSCGTPVTNANLTNNGDCITQAERIVEARKLVPVRATIGTVGFFNAIAGKDVITVTDSNYGIEGTHRIAEIRYNFGADTSTKITLDNTRAVITDFIG